MAQTIKLKRSATQNAVPSTSSLALGEIAINTYDGKLFIKKDVSGTESIVTIGEVGANSIGPTELASTAVTAGSYGSTSAIPVITIDADGRITSASTATISGLSANSVTSTEIAANAVGISELNVTDGTDGQVLTTDGNGTLTFEDQSGGAASATAFSTNIANGDGSTAAFTLSESPSSESKIIAFINGVFQNQDAYTISGTTITFDTAPISGTNNVVVYVIGDVYSGESVLISNFSGNGTTTAFTLANNPGNENNTQVYIDGVYQQKTTYSVSGTTLTFSSAPPTGTNNIEVVMLTSTTVNTPAAGSVVTASMADDSVTGAKLVSSAVTTAKIADANVTTAKIADANVTTAKIADDAVTIGKIADAALVIESEGIGSNDNDTTLPTSAAVKDYVDTQVAGKDNTDEITEGSTNLYFTDARADARIAAADTDDLSEGSSNLYYTDARVGTYISGNRTYGNITTTGYLAGPSTFTIDPAAVGDNTGTLVIAGNLQVDGTTTTINSTTLTVDDKLVTLASGSANAGAANGAGIEVDISGVTNPSILYDGTNDEWDFNKSINVTGSGSVNLASQRMTTSGDFTIDSAGDINLDAGGSDIKFRGSGLLFGQISTNGGGDFILRSYLSDKDTIFQGNDGGSVITALTLDMSAAGAATFNSTGTFAGGATNFDNTADVVTLNGSLHTRLLIDTSSTVGHQAAIVLESNGNQSMIGNTGSNTVFTVATGNLTLDVAGDIILDADGGDVSFRDAGVEYGRITNNATNLQIYSAVQDVDIMFKGNDGGSTVTALTLDMSEAGYATFNAGATFAGTINSGAITSSGNLIINTDADSTFTIANGGTDAVNLFAGTGDELYIGANNAYKLRFKTDGDIVMDNGGNFGIGTDSPGWPLDVRGYQSSVQFQLGRTNNSVGTTWMGSDSTGFHLGTGTYSSGGFSIASPALKVLVTSGNVGIGFDSPSNKLAVNGVITSGNFTAASISGTPGDANTAEVGPGYINLARDDTADAAQILFGKNGAVHSYLETRTNGLGFITNVGNFAFEGGSVGIGGSTITDVNLLNIQGSGASKNIGVVFNDTNTSKIFAIQNGGSALKFFDYTASAERMRIHSDGNISIGGFTGTTSGGSGARWINLDTPGSNTYSSGLLYKINGTIKAYHYVENDNIIHQTTSGVGQRFFAGTSDALTIASDGEIYNDSTRAAGVTLNGFVNLGKNADGRDGDIVSIRGTGLYQQSSGNRYGNYGTIRLNASGNWTGSARRVLITNGLNAYKFGILSGTGSATTNPDITSTSSNGGNLVNGTPNFVIDLTNGRIGYQTDSPAFSHHTYGTTEGSNSSSAAGQQHSAVQSSNASAGGYYEKVRYYSFSGNSDHTLVWGNTDSYFSAMVEMWAGCSNGGTRNNIYVRGLWHSNHTSHLWDELDRTANVSNGDTFTFTAGEYSSGSTASKLTLFHDYGSGSFYYGKVKITVITGDYSYYNIS